MPEEDASIDGRTSPYPCFSDLDPESAQNSPTHSSAGLAIDESRPCSTGPPELALPLQGSSPRFQGNEVASPTPDDQRLCTPTLPVKQIGGPGLRVNAEIYVNDLDERSPIEYGSGEPMKLRRTPLLPYNYQTRTSAWKNQLRLNERIENCEPLLKSGTTNPIGLTDTKVFFPNEEDSDEPVFVSERSLKRKKVDSHRPITSHFMKNEEISNENVTTRPYIKSEPGAGSPYHNVVDILPTNPHDSIDLDEVGDRTLTPRKRRHVGAAMHSTSRLLLESEFHPVSNGSDYKRINEPHLQGKHGIDYGPKGKNIINVLEDPYAQEEHPSAPKNQPMREAGSLDYFCKFKSSQPGGSMQGSLRTSGSSGTGDNSNTHTVTSDHTRECVNSSRQTIDKILVPVDPNRVMQRMPKGRLSHPQVALEDEQSSYEKRYGPRFSLRGPRLNHGRGFFESPSAAASRNFYNENPTGRFLSGSSSAHVHEEMTYVRTATVPEPLRSRAVDNLGPEHFKLNPQRNQGLDYAFSGATRDRDARRCMNGCTQPNCCGAVLQKAVKIGGYPANESQAGGGPLHIPYQRDLRYNLDHISEQQKHRLNLNAQTEKFADQFGKHRHAYGHGRPPTPPGFWNADMPSTQEEQKNRQEAHAMQREKVQEMHREAKLPNGRYQFKDE